VVEQRFRKPSVAGSIPAIGSTNKIKGVTHFWTFAVFSCSGRLLTVF
jgi:hypothetical protein